ncbi:MAG: hypothetical protein ACFCU7_10310 [Pleurocapsa sp.]
MRSPILRIKEVEAKGNCGDLVYFDSLDAPFNATSNFTGYSKDGRSPPKMLGMPDEEWLTLAVAKNNARFKAGPVCNAT